MQAQIGRLTLAMMALASLAGTLSGVAHPAMATESPVEAANEQKPSIVLVHGAFADGSSWSKVIPLLEKQGYTVTAVQNPLTSFADDVATTRRVIAAQKGPIIVVGHSYGGAVITEAATGSANVKALVYIAAYAPDSGESVGPMNEKFTPPALGTALIPDAAGFLSIDRVKFHSVFCADVPTSEAQVMAATQKPISGACFVAPIQNAAWKTIPSWYLVAQNDLAINPDLERFMAKRMKATTVEVKASHVPFLSHPNEVAQLIEKAAVATTK